MLEVLASLTSGIVTLLLWPSVHMVYAKILLGGIERLEGETVQSKRKLALISGLTSCLLCGVGSCVFFSFINYLLSGSFGLYGMQLHPLEGMP